MKNLFLFLLAVSVAIAQPTPKENLQRSIGTNTIGGTNAGAPLRVENVAALKAVSATARFNGLMVQTTGYYTAGDGGDGTYVYNAASSTTGNDGSVVTPTGATTGRWMLVMNGDVNVKQFGAKGDNSHNDAAQIQAALTFVAGTSYRLKFPNGTFIINSGVTLQNTALNVIYGSGDTTIKYTGSDATAKMLTLDDCYMVVVRNIRFAATQPVAVGVWFKNGAGVSHVSTRCKIVECEIDGISNNIATCVRVGGTGSIDANNDFHVIQNCTLTNFSADGVSLENSQVYNIQLRGTMILGNGAGVHLVNTSNGPSGYGGSFSWIGGGGGGVTGAAFFMGTPTNGPTLIQDLNFETTDRLLESAGGPAGFIYNFTSRDVRWAGDALNADGKMIKWKYAGVITIDGGNYGDGAASPRALTIDYESNYETFSALVLKGAQFSTTATTVATLAPDLPALMIKCVNYNQNTDTYSSYASEYYPDGFPYLSNQRLFTGTYAGLQKVRAENLDTAGEVALELATPNVTSAHTFQLRQFGNQVWLYDATSAVPLLKLFLDGSRAIALSNGGWLTSGDGSPENVVLAPLGSLYLDITNGKLYVKEGGGSGNTGWAIK